MGASCAVYCRREFRSLEALLRKCPAGARLQVFLKCDSLPLVAERNIGLQSPRPVLRSMRDFTCVVFCQSRRHVIGKTDVEMFGIMTFEDIDVFHRLRQPSLRPGLPRPVFALRATTRQPSLASLR